MQPNRCLGLTSATAVVAASMIGAGVYTTSGFAIASADSPWTVIAAWVIGGVIAICGAVSYAALTNQFQESGGEYYLLSKTLHPAAGLMAGWVSVLAGFTGPIAIAALAFEAYASDWVVLPTGVVASSLIVATAILHCLSVRPSARVQDVVVVIKLLMLVAVVALAAMVPRSEYHGLETMVDAPAFSWSAFATSLLYISFSYAGFNAAIYIAGEIENPSVNLARSMVGGTLLVAILYVLLNAAFVLIPWRKSIAGQEQVASLAAEAIGGETLAMFVRVVILVSLFTSVSALVMTGPRVYAKMADDGFLPRWFRFQRSVPVVAILAQSAASIAVVHVVGIKPLLGYLGLTLMLSSSLTVAMVFRISDARVFNSAWLAKSAAALFLVASLLVAGVSISEEPERAIAAVATVLLGGLVYKFHITNKSSQS